ncbi:MAG: helix-turn-helix transcriptional regulator [Deltaproteobacteria bacterium]|nr:helix-turn-helix transcriptional regulator [Deltaproteobacteria bacterium]
MIKDKVLYQYIGSKIKQKRKELKLTQGRVAEALDVEYIQIQRYENGNTRIPIENLIKLSKLFNVPIDYFFDSIENKNKTIDRKLIYSSPSPELEKEIMMLKEIYDYNDENFMYIAKTNIELAYGLLKKERRIRKNAGDSKKKMA